MLWIECVSPTDSYVEDPTSSVTIFGKETFTGVIEVKWGRKGEPRSTKTSVLKRRHKSSLALSARRSARKAHVRTQRRQPSTTQRENSHQTPPLLALTLNFEFSQLWENKFLLFEAPQSVVFYYDSLSRLIQERSGLERAGRTSAGTHFLPQRDFPHGGSFCENSGFKS